MNKTKDNMLMVFYLVVVFTILWKSDYVINMKVFECKDLIFGKYIELKTSVSQFFCDIFYSIGNQSIKGILQLIAIYMGWRLYMNFGSYIDDCYEKARYIPPEEL